MSAITPADIANVIKLLERLRTGELNVIPSVAGIDQRTPGASEAMLARVEALLNEQYHRLQDPVGDGGPAFPEPGLSGLPNGEFIHGRSGMTLRDYFAARAMQTLVGGEAAQHICDNDPRYDTTNFAECVAANAYEFADAMLKARQS